MFGQSGFNKVITTQQFLTRPIKVISAYIGYKIIIFKNVVAIRVNKKLKELEAFIYISSAFIKTI